MASRNQSLDTLIVKATNPLVDSPDPVDVALFCEKVTHESDGPQIATRLLAYRIHSPQEQEALHALALLEQCVKSCGPAFLNEIGKFRFLNELIKLVSPRYQAHRTPNFVKQRILDIIYTWTIDLKSEPKILEAYDMLKKQGVIKENPNYIGSNSKLPEVPPPREKNSVFENSEKEALLQKLLRSKNPEDLQAANRLIKSMVREEENRQEASSNRRLEILTISSNIQLLEELLDNVESNGATDEEMELCKELASNCDKLRPTLSRLATETDDKEECLGDILRINDELSQVLDRYEALSRSPRPSNTSTNQLSSAALDLLDLGPVLQSNIPTSNTIDEQLLSLGLDDLTPTAASTTLLTPLIVESNAVPKRVEVKPIEAAEIVRPRGLEELDVLGEALLKQSLPLNQKPLCSFQKVPDRVPMNVLAKQKCEPVASAVTNSKAPSAGTGTEPINSLNPPAYPLDFDVLMHSSPVAVSNHAQVNPVPLAPLCEPSPVVPVASPTGQDNNNDVSMLDTGFSGPALDSHDDVQLLSSPTAPPTLPVAPPALSNVAPSLADITLKLENIKPASKPPIPLLVQESGLNIVLHSASAHVPENVSVFVLSTTSGNSSTISNYIFQPVVPKGNKVKLLPLSDNKLPAFNPFLPPPAITQIMLISTAGLNLIELKFVVSFEMDGETITEMGNVKELPLKCQKDSN